jgi:hypothetical protein
MAAVLPFAELEWRILLLPSISRGARLEGADGPTGVRALAGPWLHARRLIALWRIPDGDVISLAEAFRFLDEEAVASAIMRTLYRGDDGPADARYWSFPPLTELLPELQACAWQAVLNGELVVEAIKAVRGKWAKQARAVSLVELPRLTPDFELSRLTRGGQDQYIEARVRRAATEPMKASWRNPIPEADVKAATEAIENECAPGTLLSEADFWARLKKRTGRSDLPRQVARNALDNYAPQLKVSPGYSPGYHPPKSD